jgi:hypothetical protein
MGTGHALHGMQTRVLCCDDTWVASHQIWRAERNSVAISLHTYTSQSKHKKIIACALEQLCSRLGLVTSIRRELPSYSYTHSATRPW